MYCAVRNEVETHSRSHAVCIMQVFSKCCMTSCTLNAFLLSFAVIPR